jgi:hypothetical protein
MAEQLRTNGPALREGFIVPVPEGPLSTEPLSASPQEPLPSQIKTEAPKPEPLVSEADRLRKDIRESAEDWPITVQLLYRSVKNDKGEEVWNLTFREPRASEINRIGNPTRMLWDGEIIIEERKMTYIMGALCGILPPLCSRRWTRVTGTVVRIVYANFFYPICGRGDYCHRRQHDHRLLSTGQLLPS